MGRLFNFILLAAIFLSAVATYDMKHKAELAADKVAALQSEIGKDKQQITMLKAEWSMLTQPSQLQDAVAKYADHFKLAPFTPDQIASVDEIPMKETGISPKSSETLARIAAGETGPKPLATKR
jgi:hypothetical protein